MRIKERSFEDKTTKGGTFEDDGTIEMTFADQAVRERAFEGPTPHGLKSQFLSEQQRLLKLMDGLKN